jgi:hypothetical protein
MTDIESAPLTRLWFEAPFEDHLSTGKDTVAKQSLRAKITDVQWNVERLFNRYLGLSQSGDYTNYGPGLRGAPYLCS